MWNISNDSQIQFTHTHTPKPIDTSKNFRWQRIRVHVPLTRFDVSFCFELICSTLSFLYNEIFIEFDSDVASVSFIHRRLCISWPSFKVSSNHFGENVIFRLHFIYPWCVPMVGCTIIISYHIHLLKPSPKMLTEDITHTRNTSAYSHTQTHAVHVQYTSTISRYYGNVVLRK